VALLLAGCELPSSFEDLTKVFEGETQEDQVEKASVEQPQDDADAAAAQAGSTEQSDAAETGPTREMVLTAQTLLAGLGYDPGPLDGLAGPKTRDAVRKYQADADTPTDGRITEALLERLADSDGGKTGPDDGPDLASQALPVYAPGDTFIYSDGRTETVTDIDGDQVRWQSNDGTDVTAYRDFVLPAIRRETNLLNEQTTADAGPGALWPLKAEREVSFFAKTEVTHKASPGPVALPGRASSDAQRRGRYLRCPARGLPHGHAIFTWTIGARLVLRPANPALRSPRGEVRKPRFSIACRVGRHTADRRKLAARGTGWLGLGAPASARNQDRRAEHRVAQHGRRCRGDDPADHRHDHGRFALLQDLRANRPAGTRPADLSRQSLPEPCRSVAYPRS
jgi:peptidoglycan hydrolase-like protein with peptidoglycan-binding domain